MEIEKRQKRKEKIEKKKKETLKAEDELREMMGIRWWKARE